MTTVANTNTCADGMSSLVETVSRKFWPYPAIPSENKISHFAREIFALMLKGAQLGVYVAFTAYVAPIAVIPLALTVAGIAILLLKNKIISLLPEKIQTVADYVFTGLAIAATVVGGASSLYFYTWRMIIPIASTMITYVALRVLRMFLETKLVIGQEGEALDAQKIATAFQDAIECKRSINTVEIIHTGEPLQLTRENLEPLSKLFPKNIILNGCKLSNGTLDEINSELSGKFLQNPDPDLKFFFLYYVTNDSDHVTQLNGSFRKPNELTIMPDQDPEKWHQLHRSKIDQYMKLKKQFCPTIYNKLILNNSQPEGNAKIVLTSDHMDLILALQPERIECENCSIDESAFAVLNTLRMTADGQHCFRYCKNELGSYDKLWDRVEIDSDSPLEALQSLGIQQIPLQSMSIKRKGEPIDLEDDFFKQISLFSPNYIFFDGFKVTSDQILILTREINKDRKEGDKLWRYRYAKREIGLDLYREVSSNETYKGSTYPYDLAYDLKECLLLTEVSGKKFKKLQLHYYKHSEWTSEMIALLQKIDAEEIEIGCGTMTHEFSHHLKQVFGNKVKFKSMSEEE